MDNDADSIKGIIARNIKSSSQYNHSQKMTYLNQLNEIAKHDYRKRDLDKTHSSAYTSTLQMNNLDNLRAHSLVQHNSYRMYQDNAVIAASPNPSKKVKAASMRSKF